MESPILKHLIIVIIFGFCGFHGSQAGAHQSSWGPWGAWSPCSKTCGARGMQTRVRTWVFASGDPNSSRGKFTTTDMIGCGTALPCPVNSPVDGSWSPWSAWGECSAGCGGGGTRTRHRACSNPPPGHTGGDCKGDKYQESACNENPCPYYATTSPTSNSSVTVVQCDKNDSFLCDDQRTCVSLGQRCDGAEHCSDGSDEAFCPTVRANYTGTGRLEFSAASAEKTASCLVALAATLFLWILAPHEAIH